ncbi:adenylate kinase and related kinases [Candidatus Scalindua japonica]|uniref:Adenylate kinase n=1 Tax=Candidatus Scalindua japonica TaxID=1284222 RepID=A0A286U2C7_9BACT|nr:adenylate kinase [Candidatus Scalindua japonica]GAX62277.1 adenylate kinase and related kinases [Candidatus Scalindua japonica]
MRLIFHGPPGVGKGTQAERISIAENLNHVSSGDLLRTAVDAKTEIGLKAREYIENGLLVPDELIVNIVAEKINSAECKNGFILDGFPRNLSQAKVLDSTLEKVEKKIDRVFSFTASEEVIITRIAGRRICKSCGAQYHELFSPPLKENVCDKCSSKLYQRKDDYPETIKVRLKVYKEQTETLIDYYNQKGILIEVNCNGGKKEIQQNILTGLHSMSEKERDTE